jgi:uncharacterized membrane protein
MNQKILNTLIALLLFLLLFSILITILYSYSYSYYYESNRGVSGETEGQSRVIQAGRPVFAGEGVGAH